MIKRTAQWLYKKIEADPSFLKHLNEEVEITTPAYFVNSTITHLSPLVHFTGVDQANSDLKVVANFKGCRHLKVATGTFHGFIDFSNSSIEKIAAFRVVESDMDGWSASFHNCKNLETTRGEYEGYVDFSFSGVKKIKDLEIKKGTNIEFDGLPPNSKASFVGTAIKASKETLFLLDKNYLLSYDLKKDLEKLKIRGNLCRLEKKEIFA